MITLTDQMGNDVQVVSLPQRIISLVPSQTELLFDLGLGERVIGITKFCVHPEAWHRDKIRVGGTKNLNLDLIRSLNPDLIIGNKEENSLEDIESLRQEYPVYMSDIFNLRDALAMIQDAGKLTGTEELAIPMIRNIESDFTQFPVLQGSVLYLIWAHPFMAAGNATFIGDMIRRLGLINVIDSMEGRYVTLDESEIARLKPDYIFLSTEPFPFKREHEITLGKLVPSKIVSVDGEMFSWYGSRMQLMRPYFTELSQHLTGN